MSTIALQALPHADRLVDAFVTKGITVPEVLAVEEMDSNGRDVLLSLLDYPFVIILTVADVERIVKP